MSGHQKPQKMDPFLLNYDSAEVRIAAEFLSNWLPYLSRGLCKSCTNTLSDGIRSLNTGDLAVSIPNLIDLNQCKEDQGNCSPISSESTKDSADNYDDADTRSLGSWKDEAYWLPELAAETSSTSETCSPSAQTARQKPKKSWADMALEDELAAEEEKEMSRNLINVKDSSAVGASTDETKPKVALSRDQREKIRFNGLQREKDFICFERVKGKFVNILEGLELHKGVFSAAEQKRIISCVEHFQEMGRKGQLKERTYSAPQRWMRGKGRVTLQFGCCYNYATDKNGTPPGIVKNETVDPLPDLFKVMIRRLVRWHVLLPSCVPDSCIVNIYEEGDCIPPHIDNHDFVRPFCTVSFLSECDILFGSNLRVVNAGEFAGSYAITMPVGSVLVINGNGADVAKHCVPSVPAKRISITFRKMDESKKPSGYAPEPDLQGLQPLSDGKVSWTKFNSSRPVRSLQNSAVGKADRKNSVVGREDRIDRSRRLIEENSDVRRIRQGGPVNKPRF